MQAEGAARRAPGFLDLVGGALVNPVTTFRAAAARPPVGSALLLLAVAAALRAAALGAGGGGALARAALDLAGSLLAVGLGAAVLGLVAELLGGRGRALTLAVLLALAQVPTLALLPVAALGQGVPWLRGAAWLAGGLWSLGLTGVALRAAYGLRPGRAALALALAAGAAVAVPLVLLGLAVALLLAQPGLLAQLPLPGQ